MRSTIHIPDGYLGPVTYGSLFAVMLPIWSYASKKVRQEVQTAEVPYLAMGTVFNLMAMMFIIPIPGGTTGHITGTTLVAILLGPWPAIIAVSVSLIIQAVVLGDGGITAIGANCFNIAFIGSMCGSGIYRFLVKIASRGSEPPSPVRFFAAAIAAYMSMNLSALATALELGIQPIIYGGGAQLAGYFPFPLKAAIPAVMLPHLTVVGILEAIVTVLVLILLLKMEVRMKFLSSAIVWFLLFAAIPCAQAHSIHYHVEQKGMTARAYYSEKNVAAFSQYELYGPGDKEPHQTGRTDKNGYLGFVPDRSGIWKLKVWGESGHGFHGVTTEIKVDKTLGLEGFSKPLVATYTKFITGISIVFGLFGLYSLWLSRKRISKKDDGGANL